MVNCDKCSYKDTCKHSSQDHYVIENGNIQKCYSYDLEGFREAQKYVDDNNLGSVIIKHVEP